MVRRRLLELKASHDNWREAAETEIEITRRLTMLSDGIYDLSLSVADEFKDGNILDTFRRVIEERNALRQQVREIGEAVKAECLMRAENAALHYQAFSQAIKSVNVAACGAKAEEAEETKYIVTSQSLACDHEYIYFDTHSVCPECGAKFNPPAEQEDEGNG